MTLLLVEDVVCPFCGCLCDDLQVVVEDGRITNVRRACVYSLAKFLNYNRDRPTRPLLRSADGLQETDMHKAIEAAARILVEAKYPLLYGWSMTSSETQRLGVELAEELGGVIDNTSTVCHGPAIEAYHDIGKSTCTLGEVKNRADLIVYWGSNPLQSHMRHMSRYTLGSKGFFRKKRGERTVVVVDVRETYTARVADVFYKIEMNRDYELLTALRMAVHEEEIEQESVAGVSNEEIEELADLMMRAEFGIIFFGVGLTMSLGKSRNLDAALSLVRDLNRRTKFLIMAMRGHYNVAGANEVFAWQTGYPFSVDLSKGYAQYNPGDTSAVDILTRGDHDATLVVGSDPAASFPKDAVKGLASRPLVAVDPHTTATSLLADVVIPSAVTGIEASGTAYRMDSVPLEMKKIMEAPSLVLPDAEVLELLLHEVRRIRG